MLGANFQNVVDGREAKDMREELVRRLPIRPYLNAGADPGSKYDRAMELGVAILDEAGLLALTRAEAGTP